MKSKRVTADALGTSERAGTGSRDVLAGFEPITIERPRYSAAAKKMGAWRPESQEVRGSAERAKRASGRVPIIDARRR